MSIIDRIKALFGSSRDEPAAQLERAAPAAEEAAPAAAADEAAAEEEEAAE